MKRLYLFLTSRDIETLSFEEFFRNLAEDATFTYDGTRNGYFESEKDIAFELNEKLSSFQGMSVTVLVAHKNWPLEKKLLQEAFGYFPNQCVYVTDVIMKELTFGNFSSIPLLNQEFRSVDKELMSTAGTFLRSGLNGLKTAEAEKIHRNTFNYRLNRFIEITGLDIRDYHNALLLELYFQLASNGR